MSKQTDLRALVISPDDTMELTDIARDGELRALQGYVGGYIEGVYGWTRDPEQYMADVTFFCNEEGKLRNQPVNVKATALWWSLNADARGVDHLRGVVVVTGGADGNGDTLSVPAKVIEMVERAGDL
ncbi:hypothetical protein J4T94_gp066 [Mycobacterium phage Krypton555]|uniref:DUF3846 domain-containing protein n=1 Tax=Mycobacterium phage Krypton555 TaxID=2015885 RepID=A0A222ZT48_9CAUD|nr:hypothetical protein J4T94_gp066 [Mycobacterium phage Krypton555]ASR87150.1 hypothetical protein KRYPTON555_126 [Mycobacterium phage Krypton555]